MSSIRENCSDLGITL